MYNASIQSSARRLLPLFFAGWMAVAPAQAQFPPGGRMLEAEHHHLGRDTLAQPWPEVPARPQALRLEVRFQSRANPVDWVVAIRQRDVSEHALLLLNGSEVAALQTNQEPGVFFYSIPAGGLKDGENSLAVTPMKPRDNMVIGPIHLYEQSLRDLLRLAPVTVTVTDASTARPVPARLTLTDPQGNLVELFNAEDARTAVRLGTLYTMGTPTSLELREGDYIVYATRGMEWSRAETRLSVTHGKPAKAALSLRREVDTTGFIAADTHLHTLTHSGHGDASVEERVVTLAGDGVELAIATDHNHNTDYVPYQARLGLNEWFTAVTGNEISTPVGHINGFPLRAEDAPPAHNLNDWVQIVDGIRMKGAKVVILNHPRGLLPRHPYAPFGLNRASGEFAKTNRFPFDAVEIASPGGAYDALYLLRDWFALLNHGEKVTAVAASDTHTVGDPAGWWRSYVPSLSDDPAEIDVDDACRRFLAGETSIAVGIFSDIRVDEKHYMGATYTPAKSRVAVRLRVAAPSWVTPRRALIFINGQQVAESPVPHRTGLPTDHWLDFSIPLPRHDAHLVGVVLGDGVKHPSTGLKKKNAIFTLAVTNPVYLDVDGNGTYEHPRQTARALLARAGSDPGRQWSAIEAADDVIAVQMISLLRQDTPAQLRPALDRRIREAAIRRPLVAEYAQHALGAAVAGSPDAK